MAKKPKKPNIFSSLPIQYKGCLFDSLLELRFVLLIEDSCCWIREPDKIFYDPQTLTSTNHLQDSYCTYKPDFLVRKKKDNSAYLIEIKPKKLAWSKQSIKRTKVANHYIQRRDLDWKFKIVTDIEIYKKLDKLGDEKKQLIDRIVKENENLRSKLAFIRYNNKYCNTLEGYSRIPIYDLGEMSEQEYKRYVRTGILP